MQLVKTSSLCSPWFAIVVFTTSDFWHPSEKNKNELLGSAETSCTCLTTKEKSVNAQCLRDLRHNSSLRCFFILLFPGTIFQLKQMMVFQLRRNATRMLIRQHHWLVNIFAQFIHHTLILCYWNGSLISSYVFRNNETKMDKIKVLVNEMSLITLTASNSLLTPFVVTYHSWYLGSHLDSYAKLDSEIRKQ